MSRKTYERIETHADRLRRHKEAMERERIRRAEAKTKKEQRLSKQNEFIEEKAKELRENLPKSERWFNIILRTAGLEGFFESNVRLHHFIPDLLNRTYKLVVEIDGSIHRKKEQKDKDKKKDNWYVSNGYKVIRVTAYNEEQAKLAIDKIKQIIADGLPVKPKKPTPPKIDRPKVILRKKKA